MSALEIPHVLIEHYKDQIHEIRLTPRQTIHEMESLCSNLLVVASGCLRAYKVSADGRMYTLYRVNSGECCSLTVSCILNETEFPAILEAENEATAYVIPAEQVRIWLREDIVWQSYIFHQLTHELTKLIKLTDNIVFNCMDSRIANLLCRRNAQETVQATHQCIANEVGTSREVASRSLRKLESKGLIKLTRCHIKIVDLDSLKNFSMQSSSVA